MARRERREVPGVPIMPRVPGVLECQECSDDFWPSTLGTDSTSGTFGTPGTLLKRNRLRRRLFGRPRTARTRQRLADAANARADGERRLKHGLDAKAPRQSMPADRGQPC